MQINAATKSPCTLTVEAHAALWSDIRVVANYLRMRECVSIEPRPSIVRLREGTGKAPVYFIGAGLSEFNLAQLINSAHAMFAIECQWPSTWREAASNGDVHALPTMKQLVAPYAAALRAHMRSSSCILVGFSFCGLMAFEAAHQLRAEGVKVEMVILLDAPAQYPAAHVIAWRKLRQVWKEIPGPRGLTLASIANFLRNSRSIASWTFAAKTKGLLRSINNLMKCEEAEFTMKFDNAGNPICWGLIECIYANALKTYSLHCLDSRGILFRTKPSEQTPERTLDDSLGWDKLFSKGLDITQVAGNHVTMMQQPYVGRLANQIGDVLVRNNGSID